MTLCTASLWKVSGLASRTALQEVTRAEAQRIIDQTRDRLEHVDTRLDYAVRQARDIFSVRLQDAESFLALLWPGGPGARWLTPLGAPHTLKDVAKRIIANGYEFESLAEESLQFPDDHDPAFFAKLPYIDEQFDYGRIGLLTLASLGEDEQARSPHANFYIYDGVCRSLVLAKRLLSGQTSYQPVPALLLNPRPL